MKNLILIKCKNCNTIFETANHKRQFCSVKCSSQFRFKDKAFLEKFSKIQKEVQNRESEKENRRQKMLLFNSNPEVRAHNANCQKEISKREGYHEKRSNSQKDIMLKRYSNPELLEKDLKERFKYKEYLMPSGRKVYLQGYEPKVLNELLKTYSENDICIGVKQINETIGQIKYTFAERERTYYPDFYIKSENKIIEVKSTWTFNLHKDRNLAKQDACLNQGFCFEFIIF